MKFIVDVQLPRVLALKLSRQGHEVIHTLDLPLGNRTPDEAINKLALREHRVVITKDSDFVTSFLLKNLPPKLLLISTGNISNEKLLQLVVVNLNAIESAFTEHQFIELSFSTITIHA